MKLLLTMAISDEISNNNVVLITTSKGNYNDSLKVIQSEVDKPVSKIGYITINKPYKREKGADCLTLD